MKRVISKKLTLGRETLQRLEAQELPKVAGGVTEDPSACQTCSCQTCFGCPTLTCPVPENRIPPHT